jgi:competence ComEA-like helix-hairpin-helix protein
MLLDSLWLRLLLPLSVALLLIALPASAAPKQPPEKPININTATVEQLQQLPGIGPETAKRIVRHREKHGPFRRVEELLVIQGISQKKFEELKPYVTVSEKGIEKKQPVAVTSP